MSTAEGYRWVPDTEGEKAVFDSLALGMDAFASLVVERVKSGAPEGVGVHPPRGKRPVYVHYRNTIYATTFANGERIAGPDVRARGFDPSRASGPLIESVVFTPSFLGNMFEVTGAQPHDIPIPVTGSSTVALFYIVVHHPGFGRRPHFVPGLLAAAADAGATIRGKISDGRA